MNEARYNHCPKCGSIRIQKYHQGMNDFFCPKCGQVFVIEARKPEACFHCGRPIKDLTRASLWGNEKYRHKRCRRVKTQGQRLLKEAAL